MGDAVERKRGSPLRSFFIDFLFCCLVRGDGVERKRGGPLRSFAERCFKGVFVLGLLLLCLLSLLVLETDSRAQRAWRLEVLRTGTSSLRPHTQVA